VTRERLNDPARTSIDPNRYMPLGTADPAGHPWVSPVWFASATGTGGVGGSCGRRLRRSASSSFASRRSQVPVGSSLAGAAVIVTSPRLSG
jgi:hypothetical protein